MTETPECPYCGEEMELHHIPDGLWWYQCGCCGAIAPSDETPEQALAAALRRAEPESRVLTLEELAGIAYKDNWEFVWLEYQSIPDVLMQACPYNVNEISVWFAVPKCENDIFYAVNAYNKTWRCWLRKPTAEEMEREKWND